MRYQTHEYNNEVQALDACVEHFQQRMMTRLIQKMKEGRSQWDEESFWQGDAYVDRMRKMIDERKWVDLANMSMFQWNRE